MEEHLGGLLLELFPNKSNEGVRLLTEKLLDPEIGLETEDDLLALKFEDLKKTGMTTVEARKIERHILAGQTNQQPVAAQTTNASEIAALRALLETMVTNLESERTASNDFRQQVEQLRAEQQRWMQERPPRNAEKTWAQTAKKVVITGLAIIGGLAVVAIVGGIIVIALPEAVVAAPFLVGAAFAQEIGLVVLPAIAAASAPVVGAVVGAIAYH